MASLSRLGPLGVFHELRHEYDRAVLVLAVGDLVASFGFSLVFPFLTIYLTAVVGASATEAGLVLGLYSIASMGSNAVGGWLADRFGRRVVMIGSITLTSLTIIAMGQAHDLEGLAVLTLALGVVDPAFVPAARASVADVVPEQRRQRAYGLLAVAASVGWIAGPSIGAGLATLGYPLLFTVAGAVLLGYTALLVVAFPETRPLTSGAPPSPHRTTAPVPRPSPHQTTASAAAPHDPQRAVLTPPEVVHGTILPGGPETLDALGQPLAGRAPVLRVPDARTLFLAFLPIAVLIHGTTFQWVVTLPIHASRDLGVSTATWGLLFAFNGLLIVLFQMRVSTLTERWAKPTTMALGMAAYALGYLAVVAAGLPGLTTLVLASVVILATIGEMLVFPVEPAYVSDLSPLTRRGRYQGAFGAAAGLGSGIGPPLGGLALDRLPGPLPWLLIAGTGIIASAALLWLAQKTRGAVVGGRPTAAGSAP
jgi:MFS family permease